MGPLPGRPLTITQTWALKFGSNTAEGWECGLRDQLLEPDLQYLTSSHLSLLITKEGNSFLPTAPCGDEHCGPAPSTPPHPCTASCSPCAPPPAPERSRWCPRGRWRASRAAGWWEAGWGCTGLGGCWALGKELSWSW